MPIRPHLVPLLKGALDPRRGIILRTYYVRPDKLAEMIERARTVPIKSYVADIPNYSALSKAVKIDDISGLRDLFPKKSAAWGYVKDRAKMKTPAQQRGRLSQTLYALALRPDTIVVQAGRKFLRGASTKYDVVVIESTKPTKDGGAMKVKYTPVLQQTPHPEQHGLELSRILALINMRPRKLTDVILSLVTKETFKDKTSLLPNLLLSIHTFMASPVVWTEVLSTWITYWATDEKFRLSNHALLQHLAALRTINRRRFDAILDTYEIPPTISHALKLAETGFEAVIESRKLDEIQKAILLNMTTPEKQVPVLYAYVQGHPELSLSIKAAVANLVLTDKAAKLFEAYFQNAEVLDEFIAWCRDGAPPTCAMLMAEMKAAKHQNWHFIPYSLAQHVPGHPLICQAPTRFLKILPLPKFDLSKFTKKTVHVHLDVPELDTTPFVHFQPVMAFKKEENGLELKDAKVMKEEGDCVVVLHPILAIAKK